MSGVDPVAHAEAVRERERRASFVALHERKDEVGEAARIFASMSPEDRAVWIRMLRVGHDYERLVEQCRAIKSASAEPALLPDGSLPRNKMVATPHETFALATFARRGPRPASDRTERVFKMNVKDRGPYVQTVTGRHWYFMNPSPEDVHVDDLRALSRICRFGGHLRPEFDLYSVAEHSVRVALLMPDSDTTLRLAAILHDAGEAYPPGDVLGPVVRALKKRTEHLRRIGSFEDATLMMRSSAQWCVEQHFGLNVCAEYRSRIAEADLKMLATERRDLVAESCVNWGDLPDPLPAPIVPWTATDAWCRFSTMLQELRSAVSAAHVDDLVEKRARR